jgi:hypothetical protein
MPKQSVPKNHYKPVIELRNYSFLSVMTKRAHTETIKFFVHEVSANDIGSLLKDQLKYNMLGCDKFKSYDSFHVLVNEEDFPLISNTGFWHSECLNCSFLWLLVT